MSTDGIVSKEASLVQQEAHTEKEKMDEGRRRWEEMDMDCLAYAFNKAGMESLLLSLPFVCKSWHKATLSPICWTCLVFPKHIPSPVFVKDFEQIGTPPWSFGTFYDKFIDQYGIDTSRFSITTFVKMVVDRSKGQATVLELPQFSTEAALRYVSDACPLLKTLYFQDNLVTFKHYQILPEVIGKWKFLESLLLGGTALHIWQQLENGTHHSQNFHELLTVDGESPSCDYVLERTIVQIGTHCKHFRELSFALTHLRQAEALAIVNFLPQLGTIWVFRCIIDRDSLLTIARGCKVLQVMHAENCTGFEELVREVGEVVCEYPVLNDALPDLLVTRIPDLVRDHVIARVGDGSMND